MIVTLATEVMGWKAFHGYVSAFPGYPVLVEKRDRWRFYDKDGVGSAWNPLESISDAWMIVERMRENWYVRLEDTEGSEGLNWEAHFDPGMVKMRSISTASARADTAPRAICEAALKAVAAQTPKGEK